MYICASKYLFRSHSFVPFLSSISSKKEVASKPQTFLIAPLFHVLQPGLVDLVPKDANWQVSNRSLCTYLKLQTDKIYCVSKEKLFLFVWQYMFLLGGNFMPGTEKLWGELLFPEEKMVVFSTEGRKTIFSEGNKCSSQSFFWPRHNVFSLKDTFSSYFILWPPISLYFLMGSVSYCPHEFC